MEFKPLYPDDDKAKLTISKTDEWNISFIFEILEDFRNRLWITFWTTIWYGNSWEIRIPMNIKKHISNIADYTPDKIINKDDKWDLKIIRSSWSSDITISYRLKNPEKLKDNYQILRDFSFWNLNVFLQRRNPNVPDLPSKLVKPIQRESLQQQRGLWNLFIRENGGFNCIYTDAIIEGSSYDLDHFIPWSFVSHNQMWNLLPADSSINSTKSDKLPDLDRFLYPFTQKQHDFVRYIYAHRPNEKLLEDWYYV